jgi:hypothetical protein
MLPVLPVTAHQGAGERLTDKQVKQVIEDVDQSRDRFEDQLDGKVKSSTLRTATGEIRVDKYLDDLQDNVKHLKDRFSTSYSASKEAETVLKQGTEINTAMRAQPKEIKGSSEWDTLAQNLNRLAQAYRTSFPLPPDASVRRINDGEAAQAANNLAKSADELKDQVGKDSSIPKPAKDGIKSQLETVSKQASALKSRLSDGQPATAEMRTLMGSLGSVTSLMGTTTMMPATTSAWKAVQGPLDSLKQAFDVR